MVVLGLVTTKRPKLEAREDLIRDIREASRFVPLDRLALSPQVLREQFRPAGALRSSNQQEAETLAPVNAFRRAGQPDGPAAAAPEAANYNAEELRPAAEGR